MALRLPGLQPVHTVARTRDLPRRPGASPRWRYAYRGDSRCHTVAGKGFTPPPGNLSPLALRLPGLQPVPHRSPD
ncbi:TPA: hypothetical protein ACTY9I_003423 [Raoultella planticola]